MSASPEKSFASAQEDTIIAVNNLHKQYKDHAVLSGVSLAAHPGDVVVLLGPSGGGKSTLLRCLNFLTLPDAGDYYFHGKPVTLQQKKKGVLCSDSEKKVRELRVKMGMVFQQFHLWPHLTALENVTEAPLWVLKQDKDVVLKRALTLLEKVGLSDKLHSYPAQLSGGQQQRVAIARALAMEPEILLFDEPTSALDPKRVDEVLQVMKLLAKEGKTMVVATHELSFAREVATKVLFLWEGKILEQGTPEEMFTSPKTQLFKEFINYN